MLTNQLMAYVALWVLWGNTALVGLAAAKQALTLLARASRLRGKLVSGRVVGAGPIAEVSVEQVGRQGAGSERSIVWHDKAYRSRILGGSIEIAGVGVARLDAAPDAEVWVDAADVEQAAACPSLAEFESAFQAARKVKGTTRTVTVALRPGAWVSVAGALQGEGEHLHVAPVDRHAIFAIDPLRFAGDKSRLVFAVFLPGIILGAAIPTILALHEPVFDSLVSKLGGLTGFIFFLLVLPAGTALRDWLREPHVRIVRGRWTAPRPEPAAADSQSAG